MLGVVWDHKYDGEGVRVRRVIKNSPAYREESRLFEGDVVMAVDDVDIERDNIYRIMEGKSGELVRLQVLDKEGRKREVRIRPSDKDEINKCLYEEWVDRRRVMVEEFSGGRLGYIHIPHMGWASVDGFQQELYRQGLGKEGLVIDVRDNSGGWIADYLLMMLDTRVHSYTIWRGGKLGYPISERLPYYVWTKPSIVLINEKTVSNGEIFAHAYKTLGIGKLVGNKTQGGVISTGTRTLRDGTRYTVPGRGWYRISDEVNLEGGGAIPDYYIYNPPYEDIQPADEQLKKAVEILLKQLDGE
jgi:tricorn protease